MSDKKLRAGFFGCGGNSFLVTDYLRSTIEEAGYELVVCTEWDNATIPWSLETWPDDMASCDVILCPQRVDVQPGKSHVKAATAMGIGMPVICSPLQAYKEIIQHGKNGFIAETKEQWKQALMDLRPAAARRAIGKIGKSTIKPYRIENNINNYISFFEGLVNDTIKMERTTGAVPAAKAQEVVDIIIPSYNNVDYLKLTVTSIQMNTLYPYHIIISDAGSGTDTWTYLNTLKGITVLGKEGVRLNFSQACNAGIKRSHTNFFVILNSDVVVSKGWLTKMVHHMETQNRLASCGVLSNCDRGWLHDRPGKPVYPMRLEKAGIDLHPGMKMEEIAPHLDELYAFMEASNEKYRDVYTPQPWVAAYATIYARSAINEAGLFDEQFQSGCEDLDLARRLEKLGFFCGQSIGSFVFHFGGISRAAYQVENREEYDKKDILNHDILGRKWAKKHVAIWTGPAWEPWDRKTVDAGMGGSETWAAYLGEALVKKGYDVTIYNDLRTAECCDMITEDSYVRYVDHKSMLDDLKYRHYDYFIASRSTEVMKQTLHSSKNFVMIHDIWLSPDPAYDVMAWKVAGYAYLSEWHKEFLLKHHSKIPEGKMFLTANGVNSLLYKCDDADKLNQTVYSSSPDRGLWQLLQMLPEIRKEVPDFTVKVTYGFLNWQEACKRRDDRAGLAFIEKIKAAMNQPGVDFLDRVDKGTLARLQCKSKLWLYPTHFTETFCIGAVENGMAHNAIITTDLAGLKTTVGSAGVLIPPTGMTMIRDVDYPEECKRRFIDETVQVCMKDDYRKALADKAQEKMREYTWDSIADGWIGRFNA